LKNPHHTPTFYFQKFQAISIYIIQAIQVTNVNIYVREKHKAMLPGHCFYTCLTYIGKPLPYIWFCMIAAGNTIVFWDWSKYAFTSAGLKYHLQQQCQVVRCCHSLWKETKFLIAKYILGDGLVHRNILFRRLLYNNLNVNMITFGKFIIVIQITKYRPYIFVGHWWRDNVYLYRCHGNNTV